MRVILDIRPMLESQRSGVANYAARLLNALLERPQSPGRDYAFFCNAWKRPLPADLPPVSPRLAHRFSHYPNRLLNAGFAGLGWPRVEGLAGPADLVYLPNLNFIATKLPYVVTVHDLSFERYPEFFSVKQRAWHDCVRPRRLVRGAAAVVAVSEHTKADVVELYGVPAERVTVINPAAAGSFGATTPAETADVRRRYRLPDRFFLYLGTLEPRKNVSGIISAFERLPANEQLVIAGGRGWLYRDIFRHADGSPARDRIRFLDYVADEDKPALYAAALAFIYPSYYEGFGMPPLEAMAAGCPVVASRTSSLGEVVGDAGLLVDPHDAAELAEAMAAVAGDGRLRADLVAAGRERAKRFSWEKSAGRLDELFGRLAR